RGSYRFEPLPLNAWLEEQLAAWTSTGSDVRYIDAGPADVMLNAARMALGRLLDNLITNAFNHGKPPVEVKLEATADAVLITVSDHGPGISAERRAEALRPFSRLDDARTRTGSVGLGLALAEAIVRA